MFWTTLTNIRIKEIIKLQIENNSEYELIKKDFDTNNETKIINAIFNCYESFIDYSIYKIMDSIEYFMQEHNIKSVEKAIQHSEFAIAD